VQDGSYELVCVRGMTNMISLLLRMQTQDKSVLKEAMIRRSVLNMFILF